MGHINLLAQLAGKTVLPASVQNELLHEAAPATVRAWAESPPTWVEVRTAEYMIDSKDISLADCEAISLAKELNASVLLMDDSHARRLATRMGFATMGTVGLLETAAMRDLISLPAAFEELRATSCYLKEEVIENALQRDAERRRNR